MILIADSGSTKTHWRFIDRDGNIHQVQTAGMNPYFSSREEMATICAGGPASLFPAEAVEKLHFYGSGLGTQAMTLELETVLRELFIHAEIFVEHDLLAAARALCGTAPGIALILGTGANSCVYDGTKITANQKSLGYILGDEGSGADLGKRWASAVLNNRVSERLSKAFFQAHGVDHELILRRTYREAQPNRFLASFAPFLKQHLAEPEVSELVNQAFEELFERSISRYPEHQKLPVHACGSVAYFFARNLKYAAEKRGIHIGNVIKEPIAALTIYHLENR